MIKYLSVDERNGYGVIMLYDRQSVADFGDFADDADDGRITPAI